MRTASLTVIIPVYNSEEHLRASLEHLARSSMPPRECIVVDDGSTDGSAAVAREFGATVLQTGRRRGPAFARNLGARAATTDLLFFLDADVCVHFDTIERVQTDFAEDASLDALIGSYDPAPLSPDFLSQYRNLMHCYVHQTSRSQACTFWSGCGAIRKSVFLEHSGFDESYGRPAIEDIELGFRLVRAGRKIVLDRALQVKHLKRWTFFNLLKTDILDRGIPWTELILRDRHMPNDLNLHLSERISVALAFLVLLGSTVGAIIYGGYFLTPLFALVFFLLGTYWLDAAMHTHGKPVTVAMTSVLGLIVLLAWFHGMLGIIPPIIFGYLLLFLRHRYAYQTDARQHMTGALYGLYCILTVTYIFTYLPQHALVFSVFVLLTVLGVVNLQFYLFLAKHWGRLFALAAVPFHLLYHLYNGISFVAGAIRFGWKSIAAHHRATPVADATRAGRLPRT